MPLAARAPGSRPRPPPASPRLPTPLLALRGRGSGEQVSLDLLAGLLPTTGWTLERAPTALLASEAVALAPARPGVPLLPIALVPGGLSHAQLLCLRLRAALPERPRVVAAFGARDGALDDLLRALSGSGAEPATSLGEALHRLTALRSVLPGATKDAIKQLPEFKYADKSERKM